MRRSISWAAWAVCIASMIVGCEAELPEGVFSCTTDDDCPGGWSCRKDLRCYAKGEGPAGSDASANGAGTDSGANGGNNGNGGTLDGSATGSDGGGASCPATHSCVPAAPDGWSGPLAVAKGAALADCAADYPDSALVAGEDPTATPAACDCECGDATGVTCSNTVTVSYFGGASCLVAPSGSKNFTAGSCASSGMPNGAVRMRVAGSTVANSGQCPPTSNHTFAAPVWGTQVRACTGAADLAGCAGDALCLPRPAAPFDATLCIYRAADSACPSEYPARSQYYTKIEDTRACSECTCQLPVGATCNVRATLYSGSCPSPGTILPSPPPTIDNGECAAIPSLSNITTSTRGTTGGTCAAAGGVPSGGVSADGVVTVCCR